MNNINLPPVVKNLLIINVIFFLAKMLLSTIDLDYWFGASYLFSPDFRVWQIITYMFMHANYMHIFFNMFAVFMFGPILENHWGSKRFINFYLITGLGALAMQYAVQTFEVYQITGYFHPNLAELKTVEFTQSTYNTFLGIYGGKMVGASGAVFGLLVAFGMLYPNVELMLMFIPVPIKAKYFVSGYVVIEIILGLVNLQGDSVAHFAHIGGALIGFILVKLWRNKNTYYDYYD
jgi:membrane associated rhomboid family serine protease